MSFENVLVQSTRNGVLPIIGFREDLAIFDVVQLSLTSMLGVSSVTWILKGRPEGSNVGGAGPEPITLAIAASCSFTVDADDGAFHRDGSYVFDVVINAGSPGETRKTVEVARLSGLTIVGPGGNPLPLRKMGGFESQEDTEKDNIRQGWKTQAIRWLEWQRQNGGGGGGGGVAGITAGPGISITGTGTVPIINNTGVLAIGHGAGISITGTGANPIVTNTGVLSITAGTNISNGGTAQDWIINGAAGGGGAAPTLFRRPNITAMVAIDASGFLTSDCHICEVLSVGDFYRYTPSTTIPQTDGVSAILNTGGGGGQWVRMNIPNLIFQQATYWAIDPSNSTGVADDENQGWGTSQAAADAVPLRSRAELNRRMVGVDAPSTRFFHLLSSETTLSGSDVLTNLKSGHGQGFPIFIGKKTQIGSDYTVTAFASANPAANTGYLLSATGLGAGGNVGKLVTNAAETKWAVIKSSQGANQVRTQSPDSWDAVSFSGSYNVAFSVGETVRVWDLPVLRNYPFTDQVMFPAVEACEIQGAVANPTDFGCANLGVEPSISHSILNGVFLYNGGFGGGFIGCLFAKNSSAFGGLGNIQLSSCGMLGLSMVYANGLFVIGNAVFDLENSSLQLQANAQMRFANGGRLSAFNVPNTVAGGHMIRCSSCARFLATAGTASFYGSGNAAKILQGATGVVSQLDPALTTVVTSDATPITLAGATYTVAQIPLMDLSTMSAIGGGL